MASLYDQMTDYRPTLLGLLTGGVQAPTGLAPVRKPPRAPRKRPAQQGSGGFGQNVYGRKGGVLYQPQRAPSDPMRRP